MVRCFLLALAPLLAFAAPEDEVKAAEMAWAAAVKAVNGPELQKILADDLIYTHSSGVIEDKAAYLKAVGSKAQRYEAIEHSEVRIKTYGGDTGVLTARMRMAGNSRGRVFDDRLLLIHVWVKQGGAWRLAAHQTTKLQ